MANIDLCNNCPAFQPKLECITVPKIFDQCRLQVCLTPDEIGSSKADTSPVNCNNYQNNTSCNNNSCGTNLRATCSGEPLIPPQNAVSVTVDEFCIKGMHVLSKTKSAFKKGFFDVNLRFVFSYRVKYFNSDNNEITCVPACNSYTTTVSLFGGEDICVSAFNELYNKITTNGPFVSVEASAMNLAASLRYPCACGCNTCGCNNGCGCNTGCGCNNNCNTCNNNCGCNNNCNNCGCENNCPALAPIAVDVTIGLFAVIKLLRLSNMSVNSYGNCMPCECSELSNTVDPCDFFDSLGFPTDLFAPQANYRPCCDTSSDETPTNGNCCQTC